MDVRSQIRELLTTRRDRLSPESVGLSAAGRPRRVAGLRREEVAVLAGISPTYYARLERGDLVKASPDIVNAIARALRLDDSERSYLIDLIFWDRHRSPRLDPRSPDSGTEPAFPRTALVTVLQAITRAAAFISNDHEDVLAANPLARALFEPMFRREPNPNFARFVFLDPDAPALLVDSYPAAMEKATATLRVGAGRHPDDTRLAALIVELLNNSGDFRRCWRRCEVAPQSSAHRRYQHPDVGPLDLDLERFLLPVDRRLTLLTLAAAPESTTAHKLTLLAEC